MTLLHQSILNLVDRVLVLQLHSGEIHIYFCSGIRLLHGDPLFKRQPQVRSKNSWHFCSSIHIPSLDAVAVEAEVDVEAEMDVGAEVDVEAEVHMDVEPEVDAEGVISVHNIFNIKTD